MGDENTKYFHASASARRRKNQIHKLKSDDGEWVEWDNGLQELITDYYKNLFTTTNSSREEIIDCIPSKITTSHNEKLLKPISEIEVRNALFQMHPDKSPGPDGMTPGIFQKHGSVVGADIVALVSNFFKEGKIIQGLDDTNVVLIPKKKCSV